MSTLGEHGLATGLFHRPQVAGMGGEHQPQHLGQVLQQVEAVRDLHRVRRAVTAALGIRARAVTGNHLDAGVLAQPSCKGICLAVGQQRYRPAPLEVDQHGAIRVPLKQRPVVHAQRRRCRDVGQRRSPDQAQQRVAARRQPEPAAEPYTG